MVALENQAVRDALDIFMDGVTLGAALGILLVLGRYTVGWEERGALSGPILYGTGVLCLSTALRKGKSD